MHSVKKKAPVGFATIRTRFASDTDATDAHVDAFLRLSVRYCVIHASACGPRRTDSGMMNRFGLSPRQHFLSMEEREFALRNAVRDVLFCYNGRPKSDQTRRNHPAASILDSGFR